MTKKELYIAICRENPAAMPVFGQSWWLDAVCENGADWDAAAILKGDMLTGVWPYVRSERMSISMIRNPRLTPYLGPQVFYPTDIAGRNRDSFEYEAIEGLLESLPNADVWHLSLAPGTKQAGIFRRAGLRVEVQQTFLADLSLPEDVLLQHCKESLRRNIRSSEKDLWIAAEPSLLRKLYDFQRETLSSKRVSQPYGEEHLERLLEACIANDAGTLWAARDAATGAVQAIIWNVWDARRSYYFMGAKNPEVEGYTAMSALLWHAMREAKARGIKTFDFEGSMDAGVERFFRGFGARRELYLVLRRDGHWLWKLTGFLRLR